LCFKLRVLAFDCHSELQWAGIKLENLSKIPYCVLFLGNFFAKNGFSLSKQCE
jgi:hypothetical protein